MYFLSKFLPFFALPFGVSLILLGWGIARRRRGPLWVALAIMLVSSNPLVGNALIRMSEGWAERRPASAAPSADAIVVLSAGRVLAPGSARISEWGESNRFFGGMELYQAAKAPLVIFTGGAASSNTDDPTEGAVLAGYARLFGVPAERIAVTGLVMNTADEAAAVATMLRGRGLTAPRVLLVTSAFHMPRARQLFSQAGLAVEPFSVDFSVSDEGRIGVLDLVPSPHALGKTETAIRELYGRAYYWLRGL